MEGKLLVPLPEREKVCFWLEAKKKVCTTGGKNIVPPPHVSSGRPLMCSDRIAVTSYSKWQEADDPDRSDVTGDTQVDR